MENPYPENSPAAALWDILAKSQFIPALRLDDYCYGSESGVATDLAAEVRAKLGLRGFEIIKKPEDERSV